MSFQTTDVEIAQQLTEQFIQEKPVDIVIQRRTRTATSAGGWKLRAPVDLFSQTVRLEDSKGSIYTNAIRTTSDGREVHPTFVLIGSMDANVDKYDQFIIGDHTYEIVSVSRRELFQRTICEVWQSG
jgi:hypothetical protein